MPNSTEKGLEELASVIAVSRETQSKFEQYVTLLEQWQPRINLVAPSTMSEIWTRHVADSAQTFALHRKARHWIDIGSGAGFPGLITALLLADSGGGRVELIESSGKKCAFMNTVIRETGLRSMGVDVTVHNERIEKCLPRLQDCDAVSARALASLNDLLTMTAPRLEGDCVGVFAKGREHQQEIELAKKDWRFDYDVYDSRFGDGSCLVTVRNVSKKLK